MPGKFGPFSPSDAEEQREEEETYSHNQTQTIQAPFVHDDINVPG